MNKPIYLFSGFLDSGKTTAIKNTLLDPEFNNGEKSLIVAFEQGDEEYDAAFLRKSNSVVEYLDVKDFTREKQKELDRKYRPDLIFIEFNGLADDVEFLKSGFINNWELAQILTTIDGSTFKNYMTNMKQFMYNHVKYSEVAIINRSDDVDLRYLRNNLKGINRRLQTIFENKDGVVSKKLSEELFDTSKPLNIADLDFGLWYMDALDNPTKYEKCSIEINAYFIKPISKYDNVGMFGRKAMVCCANDVQTIGFTVVGIKPKDLIANHFYHLKGRIHCLKDENGYKTCVIYADEAIEIKPLNPSEELVSFN